MRREGELRYTRTQMDPRAKAELRARCLERRRGRAADEVAARSSRLVGHVLEDPRWRSAASVAAFVGVKGEPDTRLLLETALRQGKRLWLPRMAGPRRQVIEFVAVAELAGLALAPFGLLEPTGGPGQDLEGLDLDLVLVPGLAFTRGGVRLGFGKGHYDRALAPLRASSRPLRLGVCFADELDAARLPEEPHDVRVHEVLTEDGLTPCTG